MNLFEIKAEILNCIDMETGEVVDAEALNNLTMEHDSKIENLACWYKNLMAEAEALKNEKNAFAEREKRAENKAESIKLYLAAALDGEKFKTDKCICNFRTSKSVEILDPENIPEHLLKVKYEPNKTEIKLAIENGEAVPGAVISVNNNISIK